jgi:hypothetical protein
MTTQTPIAPEFVVRCRQHLRLEADLVEAMIDDATAVRQALISRDDDRLARLLDERARIITRQQQLKIECQQLREQMAAALKVPVELATINCLLRTVEASSRRELQMDRDTLRARAHRLNNINRGNLLLAMRLRDIAARATAVLKGPTSERYQRSGRVEVK